MSSSVFSIQLFGPLRALLFGDPLPRLRPRSVEWLLALLALRHGRTVERSWLAGTLWPDSEETQALHNLRNGLLVLRKALGSEGVRIQSPTRSTLLFDLTGAEVDVARFDQAIRANDTASLREAVSFYTGPLLEGCDEVWVTAERNSREEAYLAALEALAERAEEQGDRAEAIRSLRQALVLDPVREPAVRSLMVRLSETGDTAGAIEVYRAFRIRLHEELGASPDAETSRLFQQIRTPAPLSPPHTRPPLSLRSAPRRGRRTPSPRSSVARRRWRLCARALVEESLPLMRELGHRRGMTHCLFRLGCITQELGDLDAAREYLAECRALDKEMGVKGGLVLQALGDLFLEAGDYAAACRSYGAFVAERNEIGERWGIAWGLYGLGKVALAEGEMARAARLLGASLALKETLLNPLPEGEHTVFEPLRSALQEALGEEAFNAAWTEGSGMSLQDTVEYAVRSRVPAV